MIEENSHLIKRLQQGDKSAFNELVALYGKTVLNTCYRFLLDKEDAEDISQEVFLEVYQSFHSFRGDSKLSTWIYRIAVTKCLDELKKRKRKKRITSLGKLIHLDEIAQWIGGGSRPDTALQSKDNLKSIDKALNLLPDNQRVVFTLSKIDGYNNAEIAVIMDTTILAVESLIYRAKKKIGEELKNILQNEL